MFVYLQIVVGGGGYGEGNIGEIGGEKGQIGGSRKRGEVDRWTGISEGDGGRTGT